MLHTSVSLPAELEHKGELEYPCKQAAAIPFVHFLVGLLLTSQNVHYG